MYIIAQPFESLTFAYPTHQPREWGSNAMHVGFPVNQYHIDPAMDAGWLYIPLGETYSDWLDDDAVAMFQTGIVC